MPMAHASNHKRQEYRYKKNKNDGLKNRPHPWCL